MLRSHKRLLILVCGFFTLLSVTTCLYMLGMYYLQGEPRSFWQALQWAAGTISTTGYGGDTSWRHPVMVAYVVLIQFTGVFFIFLIFPIYLIPFLEERFETRLPKETVDAKDHLVIFHYSPPKRALASMPG